MKTTKENSKWLGQQVRLRSCDSETWTLTTREKKSLAVFEKKVLRNIFGAVLENNSWNKRYNFEIYEMDKNDDIIKSKKIE